MKIEAKILRRSQLSELRDQVGPKKRLVTTNGCFDILHWGHISYLMEAKALGDLLVVGLNSDASVRRLKGENRPIFDEKVRSRQIAALECVDFVTVFPEDTPIEWMRLLRPEIHVKGADYEGKEIPEMAAVREWQGEVKYVAYQQGFSTTEILKTLNLN